MPATERRRPDLPVTAIRRIAVVALSCLLLAGAVAAAPAGARPPTVAAPSDRTAQVRQSLRHGAARTADAVRSVGHRVGHGLAVGARATGRFLQRTARRLDPQA